MAISRCNQCGKFVEHGRELIGATIDCHCGSTTKVYDTLFFVGKISEMYLALRKELNALSPNSNDKTAIKTEDYSKIIDIHNSDVLSSESQHAPIVQWFKSKNIIANASVNSVDTTGFFDEAAVAIGADYALLGEVCERIRYAQLKEYSSNVVHIDKKSKEETKAMQYLFSNFMNNH